MRLIIGIIIGLAIGTSIVVAMAKYESPTLDAKSVVAYGYNGTDLVPVQVSSDGTLLTH